MLNRLKILLPHDLRMQVKYGVFAAYSFVIFSYALILFWFGENLPNWLVALIIYTDPTVLGFFFLGGLMMLEKSEDVRIALAMTPISAREYLLSKYITLSVLAIFAVTVLALLAHSSANLPILLISVIPSSLFFISIGALIAKRAKTVTGYLIGSLPILLPICLPMFFVLIDPFPIWLNIIPTTAQFWLILVAMNAVEATIWQVLGTLIWVAITAFVTFEFAVKNLNQEFGDK